MGRPRHSRLSRLTRYGLAVLSTTVPAALLPGSSLTDPTTDDPVAEDLPTADATLPPSRAPKPSRSSKSHRSDNRSQTEESSSDGSDSSSRQLCETKSWRSSPSTQPSSTLLDEVLLDSDLTDDMASLDRLADESAPKCDGLCKRVEDSPATPSESLYSTLPSRKHSSATLGNSGKSGLTSSRLLDTPAPRSCGALSKTECRRCSCLSKTRKSTLPSTAPPARSKTKSRLTGASFRLSKAPVTSRSHRSVREEILEHPPASSASRSHTSAKGRSERLCRSARSSAGRPDEQPRTPALSAPAASQSARLETLLQGFVQHMNAYLKEVTNAVGAETATSRGASTQKTSRVSSTAGRVSSSPHTKTPGQGFTLTLTPAKNGSIRYSIRLPKSCTA